MDYDITCLATALHLIDNISQLVLREGDLCEIHFGFCMNRAEFDCTRPQCHPGHYTGMSPQSRS